MALIFISKGFPFVICAPVITKLLLLWQTISEAISAIIEKKNSAEEHLDHLDTLQSAEQQGLTSAAQGTEGSCWGKLRSDSNYL